MIKPVLFHRYQITYIRTVCVNQDFLENFFSRLRALGFTFTHPGPVSTKNRIRLAILTKEADVIVKSASVQMEEKTETNPVPDIDDPNLITQEV